MSAVESKDGRAVRVSGCVRQDLCTEHQGELIVGLCGACESWVCKRGSIELDGTLVCVECAERGRLSPRSRRRRYRNWRPFAEARAFARSLGLASRREWFLFVEGALPGRGEPPEDVPVDPGSVYRRAGVWTSWGDWLGSRAVAPQDRTWRPYSAARALARRVGIRNQKEWRAWCRGRLGRIRRPMDVPAAPDRTYPEWVSWGDFLGTGKVWRQRGRYRSFEKARDFARSLGLSKRAGWRDFARRDVKGRTRLPSDVPADPEIYTEWTSWRDWLSVRQDYADSTRTPRVFSFAKTCP